MQVILQEDYPSLGFVGDLVNVKQGFARNFLFPKKIALPASSGAIKLLEHRKRVLAVKKAAKKKDAEALKIRIEKVSISLQHAADGDRLFGSVTLTEIHDELLKAGVEVDRKLVKVDGPIKTTGEHLIGIKLHQEVTAQVKLMVEKKAEAVSEDAPKRVKAEKKPRKKKEDEAAEGEAVEAKADAE